MVPYWRLWPAHMLISEISIPGIPILLLGIIILSFILCARPESDISSLENHWYFTQGSEGNECPLCLPSRGIFKELYWLLNGDTSLHSRKVFT